MIVPRIVGGFFCCMVFAGMMAAEITAQQKPSAQLAIDHKGFGSAQRRGAPLAVDAIITSPAGIRKAEVLCRPEGAREFTTLPMAHRGQDAYRAVIPDWMTTGKVLQYYITATDQLGRSASHGFVGFPLTVQLVSGQAQTREQRLKALQDTLDIIRKAREQEQQNSGGYNEPLQR